MKKKRTWFVRLLKRILRLFSWKAWVESYAGQGSQIGIPDKQVSWRDRK